MTEVDYLALLDLLREVATEIDQELFTRADYVAANDGDNP